MVKKPWAGYPFGMSLLLLALAVVAFSDNLFTNVGQPSNRDPKFIVHGLFGLAWYLCLVAQTGLIRLQRPAQHRRLGLVTLAVALGVALSTLYLFVVLWKGWAATAAEARANRVLLPGFVLCLALAWWHRRDRDRHLRWVLVGSFLMLGPVLARTYEPLVMSWLKPLMGDRYTDVVDEVAFQAFFFGAWVACFLSLAAYDRRTLHRVHGVTAAGLLGLALAWLVAVLT